MQLSAPVSASLRKRMTAPPVHLVRHPKPARLSRNVVALTEYAERGAAQRARHAASLVAPLIVSYGTPFRIALSREPAADDARPSFAAGLHAGPVEIASDGGAACVQLDLDPIGAFRVFGGAVTELTSAMIPAADVFGRAGRDLVERIGAARDGAARAALISAFVDARAGPPPSAATLFLWDALVASGGTVRIETAAASFGMSRKRMSARFAAEIGLGPKLAARLLRFARARKLARGGSCGWADVAAGAGYADQAHLVREFSALAGEPPTAWRRRIASTPWHEPEA